MEANSEQNILQKYLDSVTSDKGKQEHIKKRIIVFDEINQELNQLKKLLRNAKKETLKYYKKNSNYAVLYGTDLVKDYIEDIKKILNKDEDSTRTI
jgi:hypothetical protein